MRPHLILHSVLLEDVNGLQQGQFIDVFGRLKSGRQQNTLSALSSTAFP